MLAAIGIGVGTGAAGCSLPQRRAGFDSVDPQERTMAIVEARRSGDQATTRDLIERLESDDPAERMLAIRVLEERTGQTLGYDHAGPEGERHRAVDRWREWAKGLPAAASGG
jgi:hypothetical protein